MSSSNARWKGVLVNSALKDRAEHDGGAARVKVINDISRGMTDTVLATPVAS